MTKVKNHKFNLLKYVLGFLLGSFLIILITFLINPFLFIKDLESKIAYLVESESGMNLDYEYFSGNFFTGFKLVSPTLSQNSKKISNVENLNVYPGIITSIFSKKLSLNKLVLNTGVINFDNLLRNSNNLSQNQIHIKLLELQDIEIVYNKNKYKINSKLKIQLGEKNKISIFSGLCSLPYWPFEIQINNGIIENLEKNYLINDLDLFSKYGHFKLSGEFLKNNLFNSFANSRIENLELDELIKFPISIDNLNIMVERITPDSSIARLNGNAIINENIIDNYQINLGFVNDKIFINTGQAQIDSSFFSFNGEYNLKNEIINLNSELKDFRIPIKTNNLVNGNINLNGSFYSDSLRIGINLYNSIIEDFDFDFINGEFNYFDNKIFSNNYFSGKGAKINFNFNLFEYSLLNNSVVSNGIIELINLKFQTELSNYPFFIESNGIIDGQINASENNFEYDGDLILTNSLINDNYLKKSFSKVKFHQAEDQTTLNIDGYLNGINYKNNKFIKLDSLSYSLNSEKNNYNLEYINGFYDNEPTVLVKNLKLNPTELVIRELFLNYNEVEILTENLKSNLIEEKWYIENQKVKLNNDDVILNSSIQSVNNYEFNFSSEVIDFSSINSVLGIPQRLTGKLFGSFETFNKETNNGFNIDVLLLNGQIDEIIYDSLIIKIDEIDRKVNYNQIELIRENQNLYFTGNQLLNLDKSEKYRYGKIELDGNAKNFNIEKINNYIPISLNIYGSLTGGFKINGTPDSPIINLNVDILNPQFDKIKGKSLSGEIHYENELSSLDNLNLKTINGTYTGGGKVPVNLNIFGKHSDFKNKQDLDFTFSGQTTEFEFLTPYFDIIDSINGQIKLELNLSGSHSNPIRNGSIEINHAKLNLMPLENTIYGINGTAKIENNIFKIENLNGITDNKLYSNGINRLSQIFNSIFGSERQKTDQYINSYGTIDLTEFFNPDFDLSFNSNDVYLSSINKTFRGNASANFEILGKDTIFINGVFNPLPNKFTFLMEFDDEDDLSEEKIQKGKVLAYDIHIPLENGVKIENSQMDGLIDGDVILTSIGNEPFSFSGNINVVDGSFYFNGNTIDQISGNILLDPAEFEPIIDFMGITNVAGNDIELSLNGKMDNPSLSLESISDPNLTQDDLLYLLVFTPDSTGQDDGFIGTEQVGNLITNYVENTLERNIVRNSLLDKFQFNTQGGTLLSGFENSHLNLYLGKNISPNLYLNLKSDLNTENSTFEYEVGYRLSRNMSIIGRIDEKQLYHLTYRFKYKY